MREQPPDPRLLRLITERDELKKQLRTEKIRSGNLKFRLEKALRTTDAVKPQQDQRAADNQDIDYPNQDIDWRC